MSPALELLGRVPLFAGLNPSQLSTVQQLLKHRTWKAKEVILREGEPGQTVYILISGTVQVSKKLALGSTGEEVEKSLVHLDAQEPVVFGEASLLENSVRSATVTAAKPCEAYEIDRADFIKLCEADPVLGCRAMRNLGQVLDSRLRKTNQDVVKLATALSIALSR